MNKGLSAGIAFLIPLSINLLLTFGGTPFIMIMQMNPSGSEGSWTYLYYPSTSTEGTSVNQPTAGPVPPGNAVAPTGEAASPARPDPFPYQPDEVIGGDSVLSIQQRLLAQYVFPPAEVIDFARIQAEDLFEVKVKIIQRMTVLDPTGEWLRQGARAFDNPRTATGESSLEKLYSIFDEIDRDGVDSQAFRSLQNKVLRRRSNIDEQSAA